MKKIQKSKKGFTLIEMVLVIAIIVILAAVLVMNIAGYINRAKNAAQSVSDHNNTLGQATQAIDNAM